MATQVASLFGVLRMDDSQWKESVRDAKDDTQTLGQRLKDIGGGVTSLGAGITAVGAPIAAFFGLSVKGAAEMESAIAQTNQVIKSTGGVAGVTADEVEKMATSLQGVTGVQDDVIESGENLLLTFTNISGKTFPRATKAALDMSVAMKQDLRSSALQLGKALNNPTDGLTALTRVGVTFTDQQADMIKSMQAAGDTAGAQAIILQELEREFGGSAEAAGKTFAGQLSIAQRSVEDVEDAIGTALIPTLSDLLTQVKPVIGQILDWVKANPDVITGIALIAGALTILGPILIGTGMAISAIGAIVETGILGPIALVVAAVAVMALAWNSNFLGIRDTLQPIIDSITTGINTFITAIQAGDDPISAFGVALLSAFPTQFTASLVSTLITIRDLFNDLPGTLSQAASSAQMLVQMGLLILVQTLNDASNSAQQLIQMGLLILVQTLNDASNSAQQLIQIGLLILVNTLNQAATSANELVAIVQGWIIQNKDLLTHITNLAVAFFAAQGLIAAWNFLTTAVTATKAAIAAAQLGIAGISGSISLAISPVTALTAAIFALIEAYQALQKFQQQAQAAVASASQALGPQIQSGQITQQQYQQASFNAQTQAFGGGFGGDLITRLLQQFGGWNMIMNAPFNQNLPSGDYEGVHPAGAYVVGTGAQPQLFMPKEDMYGVPNIDKTMGGGDFNINGPIYVTANNIDEFQKSVMARKRARG